VQKSTDVAHPEDDSCRQDYLTWVRLLKLASTFVTMSCIEVADVLPANLWALQALI
jgi:hypothetical protein